MAGLIERLLSPAPRAETDPRPPPGPADDFWYAQLGALGVPISPELAESLDAAPSTASRKLSPRARS